MENLKECPVCGSTEIRQGRQRGDGRMFPIQSKFSIQSMFSMGSEVIATICSDCGNIFSMKVENPDEFK